MMLGKIFLALAVGLLAWELASRPAAALESLVIAYPTTSSQFVPLWFARDVGRSEERRVGKECRL